MDTVLRIHPASRPKQEDTSTLLCCAVLCGRSQLLLTQPQLCQGCAVFSQAVRPGQAAASYRTNGEVTLQVEGETQDRTRPWKARRMVWVLLPLLLVTAHNPYFDQESPQITTRGLSVSCCRFRLAYLEAKCFPCSTSQPCQAPLPSQGLEGGRGKQPPKPFITMKPADSFAEPWLSPHCLGERKPEAELAGAGHSLPLLAGVACVQTM